MTCKAKGKVIKKEITSPPTKNKGLESYKARANANENILQQMDARLNQSILQIHHIHTYQPKKTPSPKFHGRKRPFRHALQL